MLIICGSAMTVAGSRTVYVTQLAYYFEKLETIAAPHMTEAELKKDRADFALVNDRGAYLKQVESLAATIEAAGIKAPRREFF